MTKLMFLSSNNSYVHTPIFTDRFLPQNFNPHLVEVAMSIVIKAIIISYIPSDSQKQVCKPTGLFCVWNSMKI